MQSKHLVTTFINPCSFSITLPRSVFACNGLFYFDKVVDLERNGIGFACCHFVVVFSLCVSCFSMLRCPYLLC